MCAPRFFRDDADGAVDFLHGAFFKHFVDGGIYGAGLRKQNDAAGFAVKAVHDSNIRRVTESRFCP